MSPTFAELGVPTHITDALAGRGITEPFAIQSATIRDALNDRDVCGRAPTGSGKTLAFGIPLIVGTERAKPGRPHSLVLAPTRELAEQIATELRSFAGDTRVDVVYGGVGYGKQYKALARGVDVLVACPGRLEDLIEQGKVSLAAVDRVVLDEADRMADMGFLPAVRRILNQTGDHRQTVLFSATLDGEVAQLTREYQFDPVTHHVGSDTPDVLAAHHRFWLVERPDRATLTARIVEAAWPAIVFVRTRHGADRLAKQLNKAGVDAAPIHGGRSQNQRTRALAGFADGTAQALIATDVAARGIHVDGVSCVVHFDPPEDHKTYLHRSGRTARAGQTGVVVSLVQPDQRKEARGLQRDLGIEEPLTEPEPHTLRGLSERPATSRPRAKIEDGDVEPRRRTRKGGPQHTNSGGGGSKHRKRRSGQGPRGGGTQNRSGGGQGGGTHKGQSQNRSGKGQGGGGQGSSGSGSGSRNGQRQGGPSKARNGRPQQKAGHGGRSAAGSRSSAKSGGRRRR